MTTASADRAFRPNVVGLLPTDRRSIPASHADLVDCPPVAALTTLQPDGSPQTSVVWCDREGDLVRVNTMRGFRKEQNMRRDPRVTLLCYDPRVPYRYLEIRGRVVEMTEDGAAEHLDQLASAYVGRSIRYFGGCVPAALADTEVPVLCRIRPIHVVALDAREARGEGTLRRLASQGGALAPTPGGDAPDVAIPVSHLDLFTRPIVGVLTTLLPDGQPQSSLVWVDHDGTCPYVSTTLERRKGRDLQLDPRVSLLLVDPDDTSRFVQVRGVAELCRDGADETLDLLTRRYTRHPAYYGHIYPAAQRARETRVTVRIHPKRVTLDAIHR